MDFLLFSASLPIPHPLPYPHLRGPDTFDHAPHSEVQYVVLQNVATMSIKRRVSRGPRPAFPVRRVAPVSPRGSGKSRLGECLAVQRG